jgi:hypothetical protein
VRPAERLAGVEQKTGDLPDSAGNGSDIQFDVFLFIAFGQPV